MKQITPLEFVRPVDVVNYLQKYFKKYNVTIWLDEQENQIFIRGKYFDIRQAAAFLCPNDMRFDDIAAVIIDD